MGRIRTVKPELRTDLTVAEWPIPARYAWVLLWGYLDDNGVGIDDPRLVAADLFPLDDDMTARKLTGYLELWATSGCICRYEVGGRRYLHSVKWRDHQKVNRPYPSKYPPCPIHCAVREPFTESFTESHSDSSVNDSLRARKETGTGRRETGTGSQETAPPGAATIVGHWLDHCAERPPDRVVGQLAKTVGGLLAEGYPTDRVERAVAEWNRRGLHPSSLPSVYHELSEPRSNGQRRSAVAGMLDLAERLADQTRELGP